MKTIWFSGNGEEYMTSVAEALGKAIVKREKNVEIIVHNEVQEILGLGLKMDKEDNATFTDRLGFLGHLLHRNDVCVLVISCNSSLEDRKKIKENYGNYIQVSFDKKDELTDILLASNNVKEDTEKIKQFLIDKNLIPNEASGSSTYSEDEEEEIRKRLENLGYV